MPIYPRAEVEGHLLPVSALPKGNLYVRFSIRFPRNVPEKQKLAIVSTLKEAAEQEEEEGLE